MQAIVMEQYGGPEVLRLGNAPDPHERPGWVTVDLEASALNWHDVLVRQGRYRSPLPHVPGADGAGRRHDTGERVMVHPMLFWGARAAAPAPEWEILGDSRPGTYAERVSVPESCVVPTPPHWNAMESSAFPLVGVTTYRALFTRGRLKSGESLLVIGASGGVATMAVILASASGAHVVVTSDSDSKIAAAQELGAAAGAGHSGNDWTEGIRALSPTGEGFDVVLDPVGRWAEAIKCLRPGGRCVVLGASAGEQATIEVRPFYFGQYELIGTTMGSPADMRNLMRMVDEHAITPPPIGRSFALTDAARAHECLEAGEVFGKIVLLT